MTTLTLNPEATKDEPVYSEEFLGTCERLADSFVNWAKDRKCLGELDLERYGSKRVRQRLARLSTTGFKLDDGTGEYVTSIGAVPIDYFERTMGVTPQKATEEQKEYYTRYEKRLMQSMKALTGLSLDVATGPPEGLSREELRLARRIAVEAINGVATHDDGTKPVVSGMNFSSYGPTGFFKEPKAWLGRLLSARDQAEYPLYDEVHPSERLFSKGKTTYADVFIKDRLSRQSDDRGYFAGPNGLLVVARLFYNDDINKAFVRVSHISKKIDVEMPEGWRDFPGTITELYELAKKLPEIRNAKDFIRLADEWYMGDLHKAFVCLSACADMTSQDMPPKVR